MKDRYAVVGNPIAHSQSPIIHAAFAKQLKQDIEYEAILAPLDGFEDTVLSLIAEGYKGVNVTVPFKLEAFNIANHLTSNVIDAEAANTLKFSNDGIIAHNTDGIGLVRDIEENLNVLIKGKRVLLIGAGGAAQGVAHPIAEKKPTLFVIANRNLEKATAIQKKLEGTEEYPVTSFSGVPFKGLEGKEFDIVINATSAGLSETTLPIPATIFVDGCLAYDMMYGRDTPFMQQARIAGAVVADGLGMLVEQAAESFYLWRGVRPNTQPVIKLLRSL